MLVVRIISPSLPSSEFNHGLIYLDIVAKLTFSGVGDVKECGSLARIVHESSCRNRGYAALAREAQDGMIVSDRRARNAVLRRTVS